MAEEAAGEDQPVGGAFEADDAGGGQRVIADGPTMLQHKLARHAIACLRFIQHDRSEQGNTFCCALQTGGGKIENIFDLFDTIKFEESGRKRGWRLYANLRAVDGIQGEQAKMGGAAGLILPATRGPGTPIRPASARGRARSTDNGNARSISSAIIEDGHRIILHENVAPQAAFLHCSLQVGVVLRPVSPGHTEHGSNEVGLLALCRLQCAHNRMFDVVNRCLRSACISLGLVDIAITAAPTAQNLPIQRSHQRNRLAISSVYSQYIDSSNRPYACHAECKTRELSEYFHSLRTSVSHSYGCPLLARRATSPIVNSSISGFSPPGLRRALICTLHYSRRNGHLQEFGRKGHAMSDEQKQVGGERSPSRNL